MKEEPHTDYSTENTRNFIPRDSEAHEVHDLRRF